MRTFSSLLLTFGFLAASSTFAETPPYDENESYDYPINGYYLSLGRSFFDSDVAREEGIGDGANFLRLMWEGQKGQLVYGAGLGMHFYSDNEEFSQRVEDIFGDTENAESSASGITGIGEIGYAKPLSENLALELLGGIEVMLASDRSIGNCSNCAEEDIDIDGGVYVMPRLRISSNNSFNFHLSYQHFLSGDIEGAIAANFSWRQ